MSPDAIEKALPTTALNTVEGLGLRKIASGKVRELFDAGDALVMIATDRLSAFDVILPDGIPGKGVLLTQIALHWFERTASLVPNHILPGQEARMDALGLPKELQPRTMVVRKLKPLAIECVVRGYLAGSGWSSYQKTRSICGHSLPPGLRQAERLPKPLFTPTTKAPVGAHDEPINDAQGAAIVGAELYAKVRDISIKVFEFARDAADRAGIILADTKFEFGTDESGNVFLIDEALTPDSSRYWPKAEYVVGASPPSYDKQFVRDHLLAIGWDQKPPAPRLPANVIEGTRERYLTAFKDLVAI
ncbi:MAG TPA: phosphoribosylaminoimidazolesuccinocarboxamide synthase [Opitutaceae bacterium]|nr:phosphoribosylaminoimidazolesuccinocarboxamide synthase [Opitutaceae bacterium]